MFLFLVVPGLGGVNDTGPIVHCAGTVDATTANGAVSAPPMFCFYGPRHTSLVFLDFSHTDAAGAPLVGMLG